MSRPITVLLPEPTEAEIIAARKPLREETDEALRRTRLLLRTLLNQGDGSSYLTNPAADSMAALVVREIRAVEREAGETAKL